MSATLLGATRPLQAQTVVRRLPCTIEYNGGADVGSYEPTAPYATSTRAFRGHECTATAAAVPRGTVVAVVAETAVPAALSGEASRLFEVTAVGGATVDVWEAGKEVMESSHPVRVATDLLELAAELMDED